ncbi:MAG: hypothetical protein HXX16_13355 [Bacteroidales bacterium]|nr:hypothetical protein [Bacteroidales bacterium]
MPKQKIIIYLFLLQIILSCCKKDDGNTVISFNLDGKQYNYTSGFAKQITDEFDFLVLYGEGGSNNITIKFKDYQKDSYAMPNDTFFVNIDNGINKFYRVSNWPNFAFRSGSNNNFFLTINYLEGNKISGEFNGKLYYYKSSNPTLMDSANLTNGKFDLILSSNID